MNISNLSDKDAIDFGNNVLNEYRDAGLSFEETAQLLCQLLYDNFQHQDGRSAFVLTRIFRTFKTLDLPPDLRRLAYSGSEYYLALMGSYGKEEAWRDRRLSQSHQLMDAGNVSPMFQLAMKQLGIIPGDLEQSLSQPLDMGDGLVPTFYVSNAVGSEFIPAQNDFVLRYGIESAVGLGTTFISSMSYLFIMFSRVKIDSQLRVQLTRFAPHLSTLLAIADERGHLWQNN